MSIPRYTCLDVTTQESPRILIDVGLMHCVKGKVVDILLIFKN